VRIIHLNLGTLRPLGGRRVNGDRPPFRTARMVCHGLLVESERGLVLVDSGFGLDDVRRLRHLWSGFRGNELGPHLRRKVFKTFGTRAELDPDETAVRQIAALGYSPSDVTDVVLTHLDSDHAGGLPDFPSARVHVDLVEHEAAMSSGHARYWSYQWAHGPDWVTYGTGGDRWFELDSVRELDGLPGFALVPLRGHSAGHCGVVVQSDDGWLLHAADTYFDHREIDAANPHSTPLLAAFQKRLAFDADARRTSREKVRTLAAAHPDEVEVFCSHDPVELDRYGSAVTPP
jgi:glyoxylase-like metal-dependent hydrolase (beta-lactamase superfamily II)